MITLIPDRYVLQEVTRTDMNIASISWGFTLGFGFLTTWEAIRQTNRARDPLRSVYIWMIWMELVVCLVFSIICWIHLDGGIIPRFVTHFSFRSSLKEEFFSVSFFFAFVFVQSFANRLLQFRLLLLHMWVVLVVYCRFHNEISQPIAILTNQSPTTVTFWALQVQFLLQIIINRIIVILADHERAFYMKWGVAALITAVNISVYCIWIPARLQISDK